MPSTDLEPAAALWPAPAAARGGWGRLAQRLRSAFCRQRWSNLWRTAAQLGQRLFAPRQPRTAAGALPLWRRRAPGARGADGGAERPLGSRGAGRGLPFDKQLPFGGYAWWYLDAESDDGQEALTIIAFVGSVFSPHYHRTCWPSPGDAADPLRHCALNVALYRRRRRTWGFTEYGQAQRSATTLQVGNSRLYWRDGSLHVELDERTLPWGRPLRGSVRLTPSAPAAAEGGDAPLPLHASQPHWWWPVAPCARVEVALSAPPLLWQGRAYHDANHGAEPLGRAFSGWSWQRAWHRRGTLVHYRVKARQAEQGVSHAQLFAADGARQPAAWPSAQPLPTTQWGVARHSSGVARERRCLEDTPFYARSLVELDWEGEGLSAMHEQVDLQRFGKRWVQLLLPFRLRRRG